MPKKKVTPEMRASAVQKLNDLRAKMKDGDLKITKGSREEKQFMDTMREMAKAGMLLKYEGGSNARETDFVGEYDEGYSNMWVYDDETKAPYFLYLKEGKIHLDTERMTSEEMQKDLKHMHRLKDTPDWLDKLFDVVERFLFGGRGEPSCRAQEREEIRGDSKTYSLLKAAGYEPEKSQRLLEAEREVAVATYVKMIREDEYQADPENSINPYDHKNYYIKDDPLYKELIKSDKLDSFMEKDEVQQALQSLRERDAERAFTADDVDRVQFLVVQASKKDGIENYYDTLCAKMFMEMDKVLQKAPDGMKHLNVHDDLPGIHKEVVNAHDEAKKAEQAEKDKNYDYAAEDKRDILFYAKQYKTLQQKASDSDLGVVEKINVKNELDDVEYTLRHMTANVISKEFFMNHVATGKATVPEEFSEYNLNTEDGLLEACDRFEKMMNGTDVNTLPLIPQALNNLVADENFEQIAASSDKMVDAFFKNLNMSYEVQQQNEANIENPEVVNEASMGVPT